MGEMWCNAARMRLRRLNFAQRIVVVVGLGIILLFLGSWLMSLGNHSPYGWVAYAPASGSVNFTTEGGLHPWVQFVLWLLLVLAWIAASLSLLSNAPRSDLDSPDSSQ